MKRSKTSRKSILPLIGLSVSLMLLASCSGSSSLSSFEEGTGSATSSSSTSEGESQGAQGSNVLTAAKELSLDFEADYGSQESETFENAITIDLGSIAEKTYSIGAGGTYLLTGTNEDLSLVVDASGEEVTLILQNATIHSESSAAISLEAAKSFTIHVASGSKNVLSDSENNALDGAINLKKSDALIEGSGYLYVTGNGLESSGSGKAIHAAKNLTVKDAHIEVLSANDHALNGKASLTLENAWVKVDSALGDLLHSKEGAITLLNSVLEGTGKADGIDAAGDVSITGSTLSLKEEGTFVLYDASLDTDGTLYEDSKYILENGDYKKIGSDEMSRYSTRYYLKNSAKGVKSGLSIALGEGNLFSIDSTDDGIHAGTDIALTGGYYQFWTKDQALNADETLLGGTSETAFQNDLTVAVFSCNEGMQAKTLTLQNGSYYIVASDDGLNATHDTETDIALSIANQAKVTIFSDGDSLDSNGDLLLTGGEIALFALKNQDDTPLDFDGSLTLDGAKLIALSNSAGMNEDLSGTANCLLSGSWSQTFAEGSLLSFESGESLLSLAFPESLSAAYVLFSSPDVAKGDSYEILEGGTLNAALADYAYFGSDDSLLSGANALAEGSFQSTYVSIGSSTGGPGGGGPGNGGGPGGGRH